MYSEEHQASESYLVGVLLAIVGGYLDVYTYITRGRVFANAMTGNFVLCGIRIAEQDWRAAWVYFYPVLAFGFGVLVTEAVKKRFWDSQSLHWRQVVIALEFLVLWTIAFIPGGTHDNLVNAAVSFVCSMQVQSFRKFHGSAYATTMCTGNLRSASEQLFRFLTNRDKKAGGISLQYYGIIACFVLGAVLGTALTNSFRETSILVCCILLLTVFVMMFTPPQARKNLENRKSSADL